MCTTSLKGSAPPCFGISNRSPLVLVFWSYVYLTPSCQVMWVLVNMAIHEVARKTESYCIWAPLIDLLFTINSSTHLYPSLISFHISHKWRILPISGYPFHLSSHFHSSFAFSDCSECTQSIFILYLLIHYSVTVLLLLIGPAIEMAFIRITDLKKKKKKNCWSPPVVGLALNLFDLHEALNAVDRTLKSLLPLYSPVFLARPYIAVNSLQFPFLTLSLPIKCYCFLSSCSLFLPLHPRHFLVPLPDCPSRFTPNKSICPSDRIHVTYIYLPQ